MAHLTLYRLGVGQGHMSQIRDTNLCSGMVERSLVGSN